MQIQSTICICKSTMRVCLADKSKDELEQEPDEEDEQEAQAARAAADAASEAAAANGPSGAGPDGDGVDAAATEGAEHPHLHATASLEALQTHASGQGQQTRVSKKFSVPADTTHAQAAPGVRKLSPDKQLPNAHYASRVADIISPLHVRSATPRALSALRRAHTSSRVRMRTLLQQTICAEYHIDSAYRKVRMSDQSGSEVK